MRSTLSRRQDELRQAARRRPGRQFRLSGFTIARLSRSVRSSRCRRRAVRCGEMFLVVDGSPRSGSFAGNGSMWTERRRTGQQAADTAIDASVGAGYAASSVPWDWQAT